jgi:hypothetical protein
MQTASLSGFGSANTPTAASRSVNCGKPQSGKLTAEIIRICQNAITGGSFRKTLALRAICSLRTVDSWISRESPIGLEQLFNVIEGPEGLACFEAFWDQIPERVRDRFLKAETLRRSIAEKQRQREVEDREYQARLEQLDMELKPNR